MNLFNNQEGLTLIEILVSLTLLAVIITVFSGVFINGMFFENEVENRLRVSNLAASIIETMEYYSNEDEVEIFSELEENVEYSYPFFNSDTYNSAFKNFNDELDSMIQQKSQDIKNFKSVSITNRGLVSFEEDEGIENLYEFEIKITWAENNYQLTNRIYDSPLIANDDDDDDVDDDEDDVDEDDDDDDDDEDDGSWWPWPPWFF